MYVKGHVYGITELAGSSDSSIEKAIENAIEVASRTVRNLNWFEVIESRGYIENGRVAHYQVTLKLGFTYDK